MAFTLAALAGMFIGLLFGAVLVGGWVRWRFGRAPGAFRCKFRAPGRPVAGFTPRWDRRRTNAAWVHDVLLAQRGLFWPRVVALPVRIPEDSIRHLPAEDVRGLGSAPQVLGLRLDDGQLVEVATASAAHSVVVGPFIAAAMTGLPTAPSERRRRGR
jgi:hypothetical protein